MKLTKRLAVAALVAWAVLQPVQASAGPAVFRDAEIEDIIRGYMTPLAQAAGLAPGDVDVILVQDDAINAFVAGGMNIFVYSGLLRRADSPDEVIGVIAHELGHIAGGHIARLGAEAERASAQAILTSILGVAAAIAAGRGDVGAAIVAGGQGAAVRGLLAHTRVQESAADQAGLRYLQATGRTAKGLVALLGRLADQELISSRYQDPYVQTHPLSRDRLATAQAFADRYGGASASPEEVARFRRMQAKLAGFIDSPQQTLDRYQGDDANFRYARAIAHYRRGDVARMQPLIDGLIAESPNDPFLHELKGQMMFENGRIAASVEAYDAALALRPEDSAILGPAAAAFIETNQPERLRQAIELLQLTVRMEPRNPGAWRRLGIAYGKAGDIGQASVALAEAAMLNGRRDDAAVQASRAQRNLPKGSAGWLKADDILRATERARGREPGR